MKKIVVKLYYLTRIRFFNLLKNIMFVVFLLFYRVLLNIIAVQIRHSKHKSDKPRLVWGSIPIPNNIYWSKAMKQAGFISETYTTHFYQINKRSDWDRILFEEFMRYPAWIKPYLAFIDSLYKYDVFFVSFDGFFLGDTSLWKFEGEILRKAGKKVVAIPYGGDAYVYNRIRSTSIIHSLMMSYPAASKLQEIKSLKLDYWVKSADVVMPGIMGPDGFGRWDILSPSPLIIDTEAWKKSMRNSAADGKSEKVYIAHAPNHRGFKGTEFIINCIENLKNDGLKVELILIENLKNDELRKLFFENVDILVEQVIFTGHGLNGLEGMASGLPVISNLEDEDYVLPFRRWSFLNECPIVSGSPENLYDVLHKLITRPELRKQLGDAGRQYAEKYHGFDAAQYLFTEIIRYLHNERDSLINLYHPLLGEYRQSLPKVNHPLINNRIVE